MCLITCSSQHDPAQCEDKVLRRRVGWRKGTLLIHWEDVDYCQRLSFTWEYQRKQNPQCKLCPSSPLMHMIINELHSHWASGLDSAGVWGPGGWHQGSQMYSFTSTNIFAESGDDFFQFKSQKKVQAWNYHNLNLKGAGFVYTHYGLRYLRASARVWLELSFVEASVWPWRLFYTAWCGEFRQMWKQSFLVSSLNIGCSTLSCACQTCQEDFSPEVLSATISSTLVLPSVTCMHSASKEKKRERFIAVQGLQQQPMWQYPSQRCSKNVEALHLHQVVLILELAVMKGALFMSGAVDQSSLADFCRVRYSQCPRVDTWWPGPHLYIGSFCLVGVKLARFESWKAAWKSWNAAQVQISLLVPTPWPWLVVGTWCKAIRQTFNSFGYLGCCETVLKCGMHFFQV